MWIHILIFMVILGVFLAGKMGRLPPEAGNPEEKKLFIRIALTGNIIGMLLTFQSGGDKVYSSGYRMEKEETGAYEEKFMENILNGSSQKTKQETCFQLLVWQQRQQLSLQKNGKNRMLR